MLKSLNVGKMSQRLKTSEDIWSRQSATSIKAQKAMVALRHVLGEPQAEIGAEGDPPEEMLPALVPAVDVSYFR